MSNDKPEKGLDALEAALASADPAEAPEIAEELAAVLSEELEETVGNDDPIEERPS